MPYMAEHKVPAEALKKGDLMVWHNREWTVEGHPDTKVKYTFINTEESAEPFRIERWKTIKVLREEPTPQENYEAAIKGMAARIKKRLLACDEEHEQAKQAFREYHDKYSRVDYVMISRMVEAEIKLELQEQILNALFRMDPMDPRGRDQVPAVIERACDEDVVLALAEVVKSTRRDVWRRSDGRSTNQVSNAIDSLKYDYKRDWVNRMQEELEFVESYRSKIVE